MTYTHLQDLDLVEKLQKENCEGSLIELVNRHSALCRDICNKYSSAMSASGVSSADVYDQKEYIVYKSALTFNPDKKTKFSTWLGNYTRYQCLNAISASSRHISLDMPQLTFLKERDSVLEQKLDPRHSEDTIEYILNILENLQDKRIHEIFKLRYLTPSKNKMTWAKIGKEMGISTQTAINLHEKGRGFLKNKMLSSEINDVI